MAIFNNHAGLNITNSKLQLVEVKLDNKQLNLENVDEVFFQEVLDNFSKGTKFLDVLQTAFNEILLNVNLISRRLSFTLSIDFFKFFEFPYDSALQKSDLDDHFYWEFSKLFPHLNSSDYLLRSLRLSSGHIFGLGLYRNLPRSLHKFCTRNNFLLNKVDYAHSASSNLIHKLSGENRAASLSIEDSGVSLILKNNDAVDYTMVKRYNSASQVSSALSDINNHAQSRNIDLSDYETIFVNGNAVTEEIIKLSEDVFQSKVQKFNPFENFNIPFDLKEHELITSKYYSFAAPTSIALRID